MSNKKSKSSHPFYPMALTVSDSDSGGGAGIQADLRTFNAFGVFGCSVITAVTARNPKQTFYVDRLSPESVRKQLDSVLDCYSPSFIKTGMLPDEQLVQIVSGAVKKHKLNVVCDPSFAAENAKMKIGDTLLEMYCNELFPAASWLILNVPEAEKILGDGKKISSEKELFSSALKLQERFGCSILLSGGKLNLPEAVDAVCRSGKAYRLSSPKADLPPFSGHGIGGTLSSALTAGLVLDYPWKQALCEAKSFVLGSLSQNVELAPGVFAMYPPTEDCYDLIKLEAVEG